MIKVDRLSNLDNLSLRLFCDCGHHSKVDVKKVIEEKGDLMLKGIEVNFRCAKCVERPSSKVISFDQKQR